jgi:mannosyltransferase OCH1-like enzyme
MIPKKIHYCWFGESEMPALQKACIETWKQHLADYELIKWDETNSPKNDYIAYHLREGNWAFVSDYVRLHAIYTEGGIYLDTDFEVLKPFEQLLETNGFVAYQDDVLINNAIAGGTKGNPYFKDCMEYMVNRFEQNDTYHISPIVSTNVFQSKKYDVKVYDKEVFYPYNPYDTSRKIKILMINMITENTYAIHHWAKSWEIDSAKENTGTGICIFLKRIFKMIRLKI